jgi:ABC-type antimicrobial peptide transport system permease subunit
VVAAAAGAVLGSAGAVKSDVSAGGTVTGLVIAVAVSVVAAVVTSVIPIWRAVNRPPIKSLSAS